MLNSKNSIFFKNTLTHKLKRLHFLIINTMFPPPGTSGMNGSGSRSSGYQMPNMASIDDPVSVPRAATGSENRNAALDCCPDDCAIACLCPGAFFEYETPKVVTVKNIPLGILRLCLQVMVIVFVVFYQLWYARGYQEFAEVEASVTTKVKGFSR